MRFKVINGFEIIAGAMFIVGYLFSGAGPQPTEGAITAMAGIALCGAFILGVFYVYLNAYTFGGDSDDIGRAGFVFLGFTFATAIVGIGLSMFGQSLCITFLIIGLCAFVIVFFAFIIESLPVINGMTVRFVALLFLMVYALIKYLFFK